MLDILRVGNLPPLLIFRLIFNLRPLATPRVGRFKHVPDIFMHRVFLTFQRSTLEETHVNTLRAFSYFVDGE